MIIDIETNFLYISGLLGFRCPQFYSEFIQLLESNNIKFELLSHTKDIWVRDYMPVQIRKNEFIQYDYDPNYLKDKKHFHLKTYPAIVCKTLGINTRKADIVLDGGNIIKAKDSVILTDKIFAENLIYSKSDLIQKLKNIFKVNKIIIIPRQPYDMYGHADGMIRFITDRKVLINNFSGESSSFQNKFYNALKDNGLEYIQLKFSKEYLNNKKNWGGYINYLHMKDLLFFQFLILQKMRI